MGKYTIDTKLIGMGARMSDDYHDRFLQRLRDTYSVNEVLGSKKRLLAAGSAEAFVSSSPAGNSEAESGILLPLFRKAAQNERWEAQVLSVGDPVRYIGALQINPKPGAFFDLVGGSVGVYKAQESGMVHLHAYEDNLIVLPSQKMLEWAKEKAHRRSRYESGVLG